MKDGDRRLVRARRESEELIEEARRRDPSLKVALYARDLDGGPWVAIDDAVPFVPASLSKVAILIHTLHRAEHDPGLLDRTLVFEGPGSMVGADSMDGAPDSLRLVAGGRYTYRDLLYRMIAYSDNYATELVMSGESGSEIAELLHSLSADQTYSDGLYHVSARHMAGLFAVLYNSSLLGRDLSEQALDLLTTSFFRDGLRRHLPSDVLVASKFGYHTDPTGAQPGHQLHECGVVYRPSEPYVLCVMTSTEDGTPEQLRSILGEISRIVWTRMTD